ncbi:hypothetical protein A3I99_00415 [Candidatus Kaiserbacteria bacterium RIFCSPLOWO2_02_FULL_45_11b]|uniref:Uncharacterized protein n=1 Tax=Candidatus Kaiserbacteria bacterium RIFCSPLOWO2_12_FULL_45_26 TaxID=1798525 RepID=A0A1F6FGC1_9BACT|nr:MAG: hypothetical protein A2Z56_02340 [Candidatus Kaiserbacteria bacterium RIFCSPHIGHO2_12_45_16]OGG70913.1 MAG: hypothetical protein A2929_00825 [Candidatus Kaiserbacteria bacterium RIFCSPLOWO2_01_FULL_45_25]OGG84243.1 MAG: hypothetical protein A3I99_00415 [Candidatus Kaiserbacteria bacterium RIFCSPLOWO2_02_FULL_45_11b]OGG84903.1 MAG: hypothetical protein A3G90_02420 [Candidatus Kaiserbacteria bacterium RIFCSPLOWO2_12_FULL_45_26]
MNQSKIRDQRMWAKWNAAGAVSGAIKLVADYSAGDQKILDVLSNEMTNDVIDEAIGNWTQRHFKKPNPRVKTLLLGYATAVTRKVFAGTTPYPDFSPEWKRDVSNRAYALLDFKKFKEQQVPVIVDALSPILGDTRDKFENGLHGYSLAKIANVVGCVAYMVKNGLEPELLRMTPEEANASLLKMAETRAKTHPDKVLTFDPSTDEPHEVVTEILLRTNPPDISAILPKR